MLLKDRKQQLKDFRESSLEELRGKERKVSADIFDFFNSDGKSRKKSDLLDMKRTRARILTIINSREFKGGANGC